MEVSPVVIVMFFFILILVAFAVAWGAEPESYDKSRTFVFFAALTGLGIISITVLYYVNVVTLSHYQRRLQVISQTSRLHKLLSDLRPISVSKKLSEGIPVAAPSRELIPMPLPTPPGAGNEAPNEDQLPDLQQEGRPFLGGEEESNPDTKARSRQVFTLWQELVLAAGHHDLETPAYLTTCLRLAQDPELRREWDEYKHEYNKRTQKFGDLLFLVCNEAMPEREIRETAKYRSLAEKLEKDARFLSL